MSRGHGAAQRHVMAVLEDSADRDVASVGYPTWLSVESVARLRDGQHLDDYDWRLPDPTRSRLESIRRACKRLEAEGLVELELRRVEVGARVLIPRDQRVYADDRGYCDYAERWVLHVRRALSVDERQAFGAAQRLRREQAEAKSRAAIAAVFGGAA